MKSQRARRCERVNVNSDRPSVHCRLLIAATLTKRWIIEMARKRNEYWQRRNAERWARRRRVDDESAAGKLFAYIWNRVRDYCTQIIAVEPGTCAASLCTMIFVLSFPFSFRFGRRSTHLYALLINTCNFSIYEYICKCIICMSNSIHCAKNDEDDDGFGSSSSTSSRCWWREYYYFYTHSLNFNNSVIIL